MAQSASRRSWIWGLAGGYVGVLVVGGWLLVRAREATIAALSGPAARAEWQQWKRDETLRQKQGAGPVRRRAPQADEPPGLVLMRDHFAGVALGSAVIGTFVYLCVAWIVWETTRRAARKPGG